MKFLLKLAFEFKAKVVPTTKASASNHPTTKNVFVSSTISSEATPLLKSPTFNLFQFQIAILIWNNL